MAKVRIKSEKLTPFGGIFSIMEQFDALLSQTIDTTLGIRSETYEGISIKRARMDSCVLQLSIEGFLVVTEVPSPIL